MEAKNSLDLLAKGIAEEEPDIIALQEINQSKKKRIIKDKALELYSLVKENAVKKDNYAFLLREKLSKMEHSYYWTWLPIKEGYKSFDEGLAFLTKKPIEKTDSILLTETDDYSNWKKRMALGVYIEKQWYYNVHLGWFDDTLEPFKNQWKTFIDNRNCDWIIGDFNNDANVKNEGYDLVCKSGFYDTYTLAKNKDNGITVENEIAGWKGDNTKKRIDFIFSKNKIPIKSSYVIFNGKNQAVVSDHFGVIIEI